MDALQKEEIQFVETFLDEEEQEHSKQLFQIHDLDSLNWTFRKVAALKEKEKEIKRLADKEKARIEQWEHQELSSINSNLDFFHTLIAEYHAAVLSENPKAKTLSTPYGKTKATARKEQPEKVNEKLILDHVLASNLDEFIKQEVRWGDYKKTLKIVEIGNTQAVVNEMGEIVPGVGVKPASITFSMEIL